MRRKGLGCCSGLFCSLPVDLENLVLFKLLTLIIEIDLVVLLIDRAHRNVKEH